MREYEQHGLEPTAFFEYLTARGNLVRSSEDALADTRAGANLALSPDDPRSTLAPHEKLAFDLFRGSVKLVPRLSDAVALHQREIGEMEGTQAFNARRTAAQRFINLASDLPINEYSRDDARRFRDHVIEAGKKTATVRRNLNYVSPVFNTAIREYDVKGINPFEGLKIPNYGEDVASRISFTIAEIRAVQASTREIDDDIRHLAALLSDTGMRVAEAAGLLAADIYQEDGVLIADIRKNGVRRAKEQVSYRKVPLVGASAWAAKQRLTNSSTGPLFERYVGGPSLIQRGKFNHASNTLNGWYRSIGIN